MSFKLAVILFIGFAFSGRAQTQQQSRPQQPGLTLPALMAQPQQQESVRIPICADMVTVLESTRLANGVADRSTVVTDLLSTIDPGTLTAKVKEVPAPATCQTTEILLVTISGAAATRYETMRLNKNNLTPTIGNKGEKIYSPMFDNKEDLLIAALKAPGGPFWVYAIKHPTSSLKIVMAASTPNDPALMQALSAIVQ